VRGQGHRGQASLELIAFIPVLVIAGLLGWQLMAVIATGLRAQEQVRVEALQAVVAGGRTLILSATVPVPVVLPGATGLRVSARAAVRTP
jgi:hypothetical protein